MARLPVFIFTQVNRFLLYSILGLMVCSGKLQAQTSDSTNYNNEPIENVNTIPGKKDTLKSEPMKPDSLRAKREVKKAIYGTARKAAVLSAVLPGAGQAYNGDYWKVPVVYGALVGLGYWAYNSHTNYKYYSNNLRAMYDDDPNTVNTSAYKDPNQLIVQKNQYKKSRDLALILCGVAYALNIIDANVSAHLKTFDVSDDLSLQFKPYYNMGYQARFQTGLSIKLTFK